MVSKAGQHGSVKERGYFQLRNRAVICLLSVFTVFGSCVSWAELSTGSMDVHWSEGAQNCSSSSEPPLQVHAYNRTTYILRESLCTTFEAPFMYVLIGSRRALLIDSGDIVDPKRVPLAGTVLNLLPSDGSAKIPLLVVHTHRHRDHRAGDSQFSAIPNVQVVGFDVESVRKFYGFTDWPKGQAEVDLGDRIVDVLPTPGHSETEVTFYDRATGLLFSGDFLMPARLLIDNSAAYAGSADALAAFVRTHPVSCVLGGHIEMNSKGEMFPWESQFHPQEHALQMTREDAMALPDACRHFTGFYTEVGSFVFLDSIHVLIVGGLVALVALILVVWTTIRYVRRRRGAKRLSISRL